VSDPELISQWRRQPLPSPSRREQWQQLAIVAMLALLTLGAYGLLTP
jgi:Ni/Co efflux regulator RcnB